MLRRFAIVIVVFALLVAAVFGSTRIFSRMNEPKQFSAMTHRVAKGDMVITVTEDGNLESASNIDIKCQVAGGSSILWIVDDGQVVKKGDKLVELDTAQLNSMSKSISRRSPWKKLARRWFKQIRISSWLRFP
jgi:HlyD family secretion protein